MRTFRVIFSFVAIGLLHLNGAIRHVTLWQARESMRLAYSHRVGRNPGSYIDGSVGVWLCGGVLAYPLQSFGHPMCPVGATVCDILALCRTCVLVYWLIAYCLHVFAWVRGLGQVAEVLWVVLTALQFWVMWGGVEST